jgi:transposase
MIPVPSGVRVWLAVGPTDMRRGMNSLGLQIQEAMKRDPHAGDLYVFRGRRGNLLKILWHDGVGMSLYAKRLERGKFIWPSPANGVVAISAAQLAYMLEGFELATIGGRLRQRRRSCHRRGGFPTRDGS